MQKILLEFIEWLAKDRKIIKGYLLDDAEQVVDDFLKERYPEGKRLDSIRIAGRDYVRVLKMEDLDEL